MIAAAKESCPPAPRRARVLRIDHGDTVYFFKLSPNGNLRIRQRFARRGMTLTAEQLIHLSNRLYRGSLEL